jgi:hypothetical protein
MEDFMKKYVIVFLMAFILVFQGCSSKDKGAASDAVKDSGNTENTENSQVGNSGATQAPSPTATQAVQATQAPKADLVLPVTVNDTGKVLIQTVSKSSTYKYTSYIITSIDGESIVVDPTEMPLQEVVDINPAAIVSTHNHPDHNDAVFAKTYDVPKLFHKKGEIQTKDFNIYSIPSSHSGDTITGDGSNVIIVFEVDGLRIAHMGDIGQTSLTEEQLSELGEIDIAFMQFENSYSAMTLDNAKGFTMMDQLKPKIIIPTHYTNAALPVLEEKYGVITEYDNILEITTEDLPENTCNVYRILNTHKYR